MHARKMEAGLTGPPKRVLQFPSLHIVQVEWEGVAASKALAALHRADFLAEFAAGQGVSAAALTAQLPSGLKVGVGVAWGWGWGYPGWGGVGWGAGPDCFEDVVYLRASSGLNTLLLLFPCPAQLLEVSLDGALADSYLALGMGSVRLALVRGTPGNRWSVKYVMSPLFARRRLGADGKVEAVPGEGWTEAKVREYRWALLQRIRGLENAGVRPPGSGTVRFRLNAQFGATVGLRGNGSWQTLQLGPA